MCKVSLYEYNWVYLANPQHIEFSSDSGATLLTIPRMDHTESDKRYLLRRTPIMEKFVSTSTSIEPRIINKKLTGTWFKVYFLNSTANFLHFLPSDNEVWSNYWRIKIPYNLTLLC